MPRDHVPLPSSERNEHVDLFRDNCAMLQRSRKTLLVGGEPRCYAPVGWGRALVPSADLPHLQTRRRGLYCGAGPTGPAITADTGAEHGLQVPELAVDRFASANWLSRRWE